MLRYIKVDDKILAKAKDFSGIEATPELIRDSIRTLVGRKRHSRQLIEQIRRGPQPSLEAYLKSIEKFNSD